MAGAASQGSQASAQIAEDLAEAYDAAIDALTRLRQVHTNIVYKYIILPSRREQQGAPTRGAAAADEDQAGERDAALKGTGGTNLVSFLRSTRQRTIAARFRAPPSRS